MIAFMIMDPTRVDGIPAAGPSPSQWQRRRLRLGLTVTGTDSDDASASAGAGPPGPGPLAFRVESRPGLTPAATRSLQPRSPGPWPQAGSATRDGVT